MGGLLHLVQRGGDYNYKRTLRLIAPCTIFLKGAILPSACQGASDLGDYAWRAYVRKRTEYIHNIILGEI